MNKNGIEDDNYIDNSDNSDNSDNNKYSNITTKKHNIESYYYPMIHLPE